jgi:iron-sulfur cluster repair protein YtfE (RIC family)
MTVREVVQRCPAGQAIFRRYGIPTQITSCPGWETVEQAAAAHGCWAADQLLPELDRMAGDKTIIHAHTSVVEIVATHPAARTTFERYGIPYQPGRIAHWETIEQAAAARGHWVTDSLLDELNAICPGEFRGPDHG